MHLNDDDDDDGLLYYYLSIHVLFSSSFCVLRDHQPHEWLQHNCMHTAAQTTSPSIEHITKRAMHMRALLWTSSVCSLAAQRESHKLLIFFPKYTHTTHAHRFICKPYGRLIIYKTENRRETHTKTSRSRSDGAHKESIEHRHRCLVPMYMLIHMCTCATLTLVIVARALFDAHASNRVIGFALVAPREAHWNIEVENSVLESELFVAAANAFSPAMWSKVAKCVYVWWCFLYNREPSFPNILIFGHGCNIVCWMILCKRWTHACTQCFVFGWFCVSWLA